HHRQEALVSAVHRQRELKPGDRARLTRPRFARVSPNQASGRSSGMEPRSTRADRLDLGLMAELTGRRWQAIDPLLPPVLGWSRGCDADLAVSELGGYPMASGSCEHLKVPPGSLELIEGAALRFQLTPYITGPNALTPLDELLSRWRDHLAAVREAADEDTAAVVAWPSRDVTGVRALVAHGLVPLGVIAANSLSRLPAM